LRRWSAASAKQVGYEMLVNALLKKSLDKSAASPTGRSVPLTSNN